MSLRQVFILYCFTGWGLFHNAQAKHEKYDLWKNSEHLDELPTCGALQLTMKKINQVNKTIEFVWLGEPDGDGVTYKVECAISTTENQLSLERFSCHGRDSSHLQRRTSSWRYYSTDINYFCAVKAEKGSLKKITDFISIKIPAVCNTTEIVLYVVLGVVIFLILLVLFTAWYCCYWKGKQYERELNKSARKRKKMAYYDNGPQSNNMNYNGDEGNSRGKPPNTSNVSSFPEDFHIGPPQNHLSVDSPNVPMTQQFLTARPVISFHQPHVELQNNHNSLLPNFAENPPPYSAVVAVPSNDSNSAEILPSNSLN